MFKTVRNRIRFVNLLVASVRQLADDVAARLAARLLAFLPAGETLSAAQLAAVLSAVGHLLKGEAGTLDDAASSHRRHLDRERRLRQRRKQDAAALYDILLKVRRTLEAMGRGLAELTVGLDVRIAHAAPDVLVRYGAETVEALSKPGFALPAHALGGDTFDARQHAEDVRSAVERFTATDEELTRQTQRTRKALRVKLELLEDFKKTYRYGKWVIAGCYGLAGEEFHLERLEPRLPARKSGKDEAPEDDAGGDGVASD